MIEQIENQIELNQQFKRQNKIKFPHCNANRGVDNEASDFHYVQMDHLGGLKSLIHCLEYKVGAKWKKGEGASDLSNGKQQ